MRRTSVEQAVIERAQQGDIEAFQALYDQFKTPVYNFILRLVGRRDDAEDALQEVFLKVHSKISQLRDAGAFTGWLFSTARNEAFNHLRKNSRGGHQSLDATEGDLIEARIEDAHNRTESPEQLMEDLDMQEKVEAALAEVPEINRSAFVLGVLEGYSYREVGEMLDCSENNVKLRVYRARAQLSQILKPLLCRP